MEECKFCKGKKELDYAGICRVYLFPHRLVCVLMLAALAGGIFYSPYLYFLAGLLYVIPLMNADLRLFLFPFVLLKKVLGRKISCVCG